MKRLFRKFRSDIIMMLVVSAAAFGRPVCYAQNIDLANFTSSNGVRIHDYTSNSIPGGKSIATMDYNGDGIGDCVIGNYNDSTHGVSILMGKTSPPFTFTVATLATDNTRGFQITAPFGTPNWGYSVSSAGDFNGDGFSDVLLGSPGISSEAFLIYGKPGPWQNFDISALDTTSTLGFKLSGSSDIGNWFGGSVSGIGDINGDGYDDIAISSDIYFTSTPNSSIFVMFGRATPMGPVDVSEFIPSDTDGFIIFDQQMLNIGFTLAGPGDFNSDGYDDFAFTSYESEGPDTSYSNAYLLYGKSSGFHNIDIATFPNLTDAGLKFESSEKMWMISQAGDFNNDGYDDIQIGQADFLNPGGLRGRLTIIPGRNDSQTTISLEDENSWKIKGSSAYLIGRIPSPAGDLNVDGFDDIVCYARQADTSDLQRAYVIWGSQSPATELELSTLDSQNSAGFYISAPEVTRKPSFAAGSDFNGDGFNDLFVNWIDGFSNPIAFCIYGKQSGASVQDWVLF